MNSKPQGRGSQFAREARIGLTIIALLTTVFVWAAYRRFSSHSDPTADLRREAMERQTSGVAQTTRTPGQAPGRGENANHIVSSDQAMTLPAVGGAPKTYGHNPAQSPALPNQGSTSSPNLPGNPAFANPAKGQSSQQIASSFYNRGNGSAGQNQTSHSKAGDGTNFAPQAPNARDVQPKTLAKSTDNSLEEPVIEFGEEASADELGSPNATPTVPATDSLVEIEQPKLIARPSEQPNKLAASPSSAQPEKSQPATQPPRVRNGKPRGVPAEMVSTTLNKTQTFVVQKNDTFWSISQRAYGTGHYFKALYEYNKGHLNNPDSLPVGQKIVAPPTGTLRSKYPHLVRQKEAVNQTSFEQGDEAPAIYPQAASDVQIVPDLRPVPSVNSELRRPEPGNGEFFPNFAARPVPPQTELQPAQNEPASIAQDPIQPTASEEIQFPTEPQPENPPPLVGTGEESATNSAVLYVYVVRQGDNLFDIARNELLQASRYLDILQLNRDDLPADCTHLTPLPAGLKLKLPSR